MWVRIDTDMRANGKVLDAARELKRQRIYLADHIVFLVMFDAIAYSAVHLTDGFVPTEVLMGFRGVADHRAPKRAERILAALERAELLHRDDARDGWVVHDYLDYQIARDEVKHRRARWRQQKACQRAKTADRRQFGVNSALRPGRTDSESFGKTNGSPADRQGVRSDHIYISTKDKEHARARDRHHDDTDSRAQVLAFAKVSKHLMRAAAAELETHPRANDHDLAEAMKLCAAKLGTVRYTLGDLSGIIRTLRRQHPIPE